MNDDQDQGPVDDLLPLDYYEIRLQGRLDPRWSDWFVGFTVTTTESGEIILYGPLADQSALHGFIAHLGKMGLTLIQVRRIESGEDP